MWRLWYDDQCEVCQAGVAWLRHLDRRGCTEAIPLSAVGEGTATPPLGATLDELLRDLHVLTPESELLRGADAVAALARRFPWTWAFGAVASLPPLRGAAAAFYRFVADNRYAMSRCRGGACRSVRQDLVEKAPLRAFNVCRFIGWLVVAPLAFVHYIARLLRQIRLWWATRGGAVTLLDGRLSIHFLSGGLSWTVPVLFGELFTMIRYGSLIVDPGSNRMRRAVERHIGALEGAARHVVATHAHEEHSGNLDCVARGTGATVHVHPRSLPLLRNPCRLPLMRRLVIGQPAPLQSRTVPLSGTLTLENGSVIEVIETPGHCPEHVSLYVPRDRLLLIGDAFMGTHFSVPNDDVDHRTWIHSLEHLLALDVAIMIESHGHVHTLDPGVIADLEKAGLGRLASRREPREPLSEKLEFLRWVDEQVCRGEEEGLPPSLVRATVFPWTQRWSYESALSDAVAKLVSASGFGRHRLVRSFRLPTEGSWPRMYECRWDGRRAKPGRGRPAPRATERA